MKTAVYQRFVIKGINDDQGSCSCCGKTGLKRVVWIQDNDSGDINHFGTTCALNPAKCFGITKADVNAALRAFDAAQKAEANQAYNDKVQAAMAKIDDLYDGGYTHTQSPLVPGMFFTIPNDPQAYDAIKRSLLNAIVR